MIDDPIITMAHIREAHRRGLTICVRGVRNWLEARGLDYMHFVRFGYPASVIEAKDDALGNAIAAIAREQAGA